MQATGRKRSQELVCALTVCEEEVMLEHSLRDDDCLIRCHEQIPLSKFQFLFDDAIPLLLTAMESHDAHRWTPTCHLRHPCVEHVQWHGNEVRTGDATVLAQPGKETDRLQRLAET